jgi:large exoprotein involved in heme utilization and adhesion
VTGGPSNIDGTLQCSIPGASFWLINSAGIAFGPDAALNISGSFAVTTADQVKLADGVVFAAVPGAADATLTTAAPAAFGFLSASPAGLASMGAILAVSAQQSITVAVGDMAISGGKLSAPGGNVSIASVRSDGTMSFNPLNPILTPHTNAFSKLGTVSIVNGAIVSADGVSGAGGRIDVHCDSLTMNHSHVSAITNGPGQGRGIDLKLRGGFNSLDASVDSDTASSGAAGGVHLSADSLAMYDSTIESNTCGTGTGGLIVVDIAGKAVLNGLGNASAGITTLATYVGRGGGAAGGVSMDAGSLTIRSGATINASTSGTGDGGTVDVSVTHEFVANGTGISQPPMDAVESTGIGAGSFLSSIAGGGSAGRANISAAALTLINGAQIDGSTYSTGNGGYLTINVSGPVVLDGTARAQQTPPFYTGISAETGGPAAVGGNVIVNAGSLVLREANISAQTAHAGHGGSVTVNVSGLTFLDGMGYFVLPDLSSGNPGFGTGIFCGALRGGVPGDVSVKSGSLQIQNGAIIDTSTLGANNAGQVKVDITGNLLILDGGGISSFTRGAGNGGDVSVRVSGTAILNGSATPATLQELFGGLTGIGTDSFGGGDGGQVRVKTGDDLSLIGTGQISSTSTGVGRAGNVVIRVGGMLSLSDGASSVQSAASNGGDLNLDAQNGIYLRNHSTLSASAALDGGNVLLQSSKTIFVQDSQISAAAGVNGGFGNGGNLKIDPVLVVLQNSQLSANASVDNGGRIAITAGQLLRSNSPITATGGPFGLAGSILVSSPDPGIAGSLTVLHLDLGSQSLQLIPACAQMFGTGSFSSFVQIGNGGTFFEPGGLLPSFDPFGDSQGSEPK